MATAKTPTRNKKVQETKGRVAGFLDVGVDNMYFHRAIEAANDSITAAACLDIRATFIQGNGFINKALSSFVVNRQGQTLDEVLSDVAYQISSGEVIPMLVGYTGLGKTCSLRVVPFENIRLAIPDDSNNINRAGIFPYLDSVIFKNKVKEHEVVNLFNPDPDVVLSQMAAVGGIENYPGQLIYVQFRQAGDGYYHFPRWMTAGINDIETERELSIYDYRTVSNGFSGSGIAVILEGEEAPIILDEDGKRVREETDADSLENQLENAMGNRDAGNIPVLRFKTKEEAEAFKFVETSGSQLSNRYSSTSERVALKITTTMKTPSELANVRRSGGALFQSGLEQQMSYQMMQAVANPWQRKTEQTFDKIFANWHQPIPSLDFSIENLNYFTPDEAATLAG